MRRLLSALGLAFAASTVTHAASADLWVFAPSKLGQYDLPFNSLTDIAAMTQERAHVRQGTGPTLEIKVLFIGLANDDGTDPGGAPLATYDAWLAQANAIYATGWDSQGGAPKASRVVLKRDPRTVVTLRNDTLANRDCAPGAPNAATPEEACAPNPQQEGAFADVAFQYPDALVVFVRGGNYRPIGDGATPPKYTAKRSAGNASSGVGSYIVFSPNNDGRKLAHEAGHYLHLAYTFPLSQGYVELAALQADLSKKAGVGGLITPSAIGEVTDADTGRGVGDTPPDPGTNVWNAVVGSACGPVDAMKVPLGANTVTFKPRRSNVMSYYSCPNQDITVDQAARMRVGLRRYNRRALVDAAIADCAYKAEITKQLPASMTRMQKALWREAKLYACLK